MANEDPPDPPDDDDKMSTETREDAPYCQRLQSCEAYKVRWKRSGWASLIRELGGEARPAGRRRRRAGWVTQTEPLFCQAVGKWRGRRCQRVKPSLSEFLQQVQEREMAWMRQRTISTKM